MRDRQEKTKRAGRKRIRIHEVTTENDIRYRGPLSFQHFQIFGWICIVLYQVVILFKMEGGLNPRIAEQTAGFLPVLEQIANFSLPFLLIANFAQILDASDGYRDQLIKNAAAATAICGLFYLFYYRYLVGGVEAIISEPAQALPAVQSALDEVVPYGFLCFNLFVDLFLCTLVMLFLNYRPVHFFKGKRSIIFFRLFALLPIGYEVGCMILKIQSARNIIRIPAWAYPLLPVKPPMTFVLFIALAVFVKTREIRFRRHGKTHEEYNAFLQTRRNSWNFSVFLAIMLVIVSIADFGIVMGFTVNEGLNTVYKNIGESIREMQTETADSGGANEAAPETGTGSEQKNPEMDEEAVMKVVSSYIESGEVEEAFMNGAIIALVVGFGGSMYLVFLAPAVLLFSYTKKPKNPKIGMLIPAAGIAVIVFLYLEGFHMALYNLPFEKLNLQEIVEYAGMIRDMAP